jgi:hypothetical protein
MNACFSTYEWGPVVLALIPLVMAIAIMLSEVMGWVDPPSSSSGSGRRCGDGSAV